MDQSLQDEIQKGLSEAFKNTPIDNTGAAFMNMSEPNTPPASTPEVIPPVNNTPDSSLNNETPPVDTPVNTNTDTTPPAPVSEPVVTKSFEELLAEKTAGKFKSWDEVENLVNTPREEFANDEIKRINELARKGVKLDADFFELQNKDFSTMTNPLEILNEAMKRKPEYQGLDSEVLDFELNKKYNLREWQDKDEADLTQEDKYHRAILMRDAQNDKNWLVSYKNDRVLAPTPDPEKVRLASEQKVKEQENWERFVDEELANKVSKISTKIDENESIDYEVSVEDKKYASDLMKAMTKDVNVFWNQFADKDGKINQKDVFEAIVHWKNRNNITKVAYQNALAKGKESEIKSIKNTSFEPNATPAATKVDWRAKAQQDIEKHL